MARFALPLAAILPASAAAQCYPSHRITLVVPYTPGSGFDIVARTIGQKLSERWGQPVVIDNKPGASGTLGTEIVANAAPDGHTLLVSGAPLTVYPSLVKSLRFNPATSFTPIGVAATSIVALTVNPAVLPVNSVAELIAAAKAQPGKLNYSSPGIGTLQQLGMELFKQQLGLDVLHVPYRGASGALTDFLTGQVHFTYLPVNTALPQAQSGKLRMLAVASSKRSPMAPDVPSLHELGYAEPRFRSLVRLSGAGQPAGRDRGAVGAGARRDQRDARRAGEFPQAGIDAGLSRFRPDRRADQIRDGPLARGRGEGGDQAGVIGRRVQSMIPKSGYRFSEKIMLQQ